MPAAPVPFVLPPGMVMTDSGLSASGRWVGGDKVRFYRGLPQKIGGWIALTTVPLTGIPRGAHVWTDLDGRQYIAVGTASNLYAISAADYTPVDITPTGFSPGLTDPTYGYGWGVGAWGVGTWGTPRPTSSLLLQPLFWSLANFGLYLLASPSDGTLYSWSPSQSPVVPAAPVPGAPPQMNATYVTTEQFVFCLGTNNGSGVRNEMAFHWCGQGAFTDWNIAEIVSTAQGSPAGQRTVQEGTRLIAGTDIGQQISLMWSDTALYANQYTGTSFVFNTQLVGKSCGLIGPLAFVAAVGIAYWPSQNSFYMYNGYVQQIPNCEDVVSWLFPQIPANFGIKTVAFYNSHFSEVWFLFVPTGATEPGFYAVYNVNTQVWFTGTLTRTSATSFKGDEAHPILTGTDGLLYQHEEGVDANGVALPFSIESGFVEIASGAQIYEVEGFYNDAQRQVGPLSVQVSAFEHSMQNATPLETQVETVNPTDGLTDFRVCGRVLQVTISGDQLGGDWRMGKPAFLGQNAGLRR